MRDNGYTKGLTLNGEKLMFSKYDKKLTKINIDWNIVVSKLIIK